MEAKAVNKIDVRKAVAKLAKIRGGLWQRFAEQYWICMYCEVDLTSDGLSATSYCPSCGRVNNV